MKYCTHKLTAICRCRSCYIDRGRQSTESRKILPHCEYVEMNEMVMNDDVDTEKDYLPYPGGAYDDDDDDEPP